MRIRSVILITVFAALGLFLALNWRLVATPTELHLIVMTVSAPLGVVLTAFIGLLTLLYAVLLAKAEGSSLLESRRQFKELERLRKLLEEKESKEFLDLRNWLEVKLGPTDFTAHAPERNEAS